MNLDVKAYLWIHLDKKVLLWNREAPLFLCKDVRLFIEPNMQIKKLYFWKVQYA